MIAGIHRDFARFVQIVLRGQGWVVVLIESYFDESGSHEGAPILCVGGYLFSKDSCLKLDTAWREMLADFQIPYFHMASCSCGERPFDRLPSELRDAAVRRASTIINEHMEFGAVIAVREDEYNRIVPRHPLIGDAYSFIARQAFNAARVWVDQSGYEGKIAYFFESGHEHQPQADRIMHEHAHAPAVSNEARYAGHGFLDKRETPALQAADILAWHFCNDWSLKRQSQPPRKSYLELIAGAAPEKYWYMRWNATELRKTAKAIKRLSKLYPNAGKEITADQFLREAQSS